MARCSEALMALGLSAALATTGSAAAAPQAKEVEKIKRVEVVRGGDAYLGVSIDDVSKDDATRLKLPGERGALVKSVEAGSPAEKAGLKVDDVILRFQGEDVRSARQLTRLVREEPAGRSAAIEVSRGGVTQKLQAQLEGRKNARREWHFEMPDLGHLGLDRDFAFDVPEPPEPPEPPEAPEPLLRGKAPLMPRFSFRGTGPRKLGIEYQEIGDQLAKYFKLAADRGVLVARVEEEGPAAKAGVKAGDVIVKLDGQAVRDGGDLRAGLDKKSAGDEVTLSVQREGKPLDLKVKLGGATETRRRSGMTT